MATQVWVGPGIQANSCPCYMRWCEDPAVPSAATPLTFEDGDAEKHDVEGSLLFREGLFRRKGIHVESLRIETELFFDGLGLESEISQRIDMAAKFSLGVFR